MGKFRTILDSRNTVIQAGSSRVVKACLSHHRGGGVADRLPVREIAQLEIGKHRVGTFRVIDRSTGNLLVERLNTIPRRNNRKTRPVGMWNRGEVGRIPIALNSRISPKKKTVIGGRATR